MAKFSRGYELTVDVEEQVLETDEFGNPKAGSIVKIKDTNKVRVTLPFTLDFNIIRNANASANDGTLTIYNLNEQTRTKLHKDPSTSFKYKGVELKAGYGGQFSTIFKGNITNCYSTREGTDYITVMECGDGAFGFANGLFSINYPAKTKYDTIVNAIAKSIPGVDLGAISKLDGTIARGNTVSGNAYQLLKQLTGNGCFVDNEKIYVLRDKETIKGSFEVINAATGLLGTPIKKETMIIVRDLFEPRILVGQRLFLQSSTASQFNGLKKVVSVEHRGMISETSGGQCETTLGLWELDQNAVPLAVN